MLGNTFGFGLSIKKAASKPLLRLISSAILEGAKSAASFPALYLSPDFVEIYNGNGEIAVNGDSVAQWGDATTQDTALYQPVLEDVDGIKSLVFDGVNDRLNVQINSEVNGTLIVATTKGIYYGDINLPVGNYDFSAKGFFGSSVYSSANFGSTVFSNHSRKLIGAWMSFSPAPLYQIQERINAFKLLGAQEEFESQGSLFWGCKYLKNISNVKFNSNAASFFETWMDCSNLESFPQIDLGNADQFVGTWRGCSNLQEFPLLDTSNIQNMSSTWLDCSSLITFPYINTSKVTSLNNVWQNCSSLISFPKIDTSKCTILFNTWYNCSSLISFPKIDIPICTRLLSTWENCSSLRSFPLVDTSSVTNFGRTWWNCSSLTSFPQINTSSATSLANAWSICSGLTSFPLIDTSNVTSFNNTWYNCSNLTSFPLLNFSNSTNMSAAWLQCTSLTDFPANAFDNVTHGIFSKAFVGCPLSPQSLENILTSLVNSEVEGGAIDYESTIELTALAQSAVETLEARNWSINSSASSSEGYYYEDAGGIGSELI